MKAEFYATEEELRGLKAEAEGLGLTLSNFVRTRLGLGEVKRGRRGGRRAGPKSGRRFREPDALRALRANAAAHELTVEPVYE